MNEDQFERKMDEILLHAGKARSYLKKLKQRNPNGWKRAAANLWFGAEIIEPTKKLINVTYYQIGIYDPNVHDNWPYEFHYDDGEYLSLKHRKCKLGSAATFENPEDAVKHFESWNNKQNYSMKLIEFSVREER